MQVTFAPSGVAVELPNVVEALANEHASGMLDAGALLALAAALALMPAGAQPAIVVEIGAYRGRTTVFMGRVLRLLTRTATVLSIDPFEEARRDALNPRGSLGAYVKAIRAARFEGYCIPLVARSQDAVAVAPARISALVLDGDHRYETVRDDLRAYAARLVPGGVCFVDDYAPPYDGVRRAVDESLDTGSGFTILHRAHFVVARRDA